MVSISQLGEVTRIAYSQTSALPSISAKPSRNWPSTSRSVSANERSIPRRRITMRHCRLHPAQLAVLALPAGARILPILLARRPFDRTLHPRGQTQLEQIRLLTLLSFAPLRLIAQS